MLKMNRSVFLLAATTLLGTLSGHVSAQEYTVVNMGDLGGNKSEAFGVNIHGAMSGYSNFDGISGAPTLYDDGILSSIGTLPEDVNNGGQGYGINDLGQITGRSGSFQFRNAFLWLPTPAYGLPAGNNNIGTLGGNAASGRAINNKGQICGSSQNADGETYAFIWLPEADYGMAAGMHQIDSFGFTGFGTYSSALGINDKGEVCGYARDENGISQGMLWLPVAAYGLPAGINNLGTFGGDSTLLWDINELGQISGYSKNASDDILAAVWLPSPALGLRAGLNNLGTLGGRDAAMLSINDHGVMVGWSQLSNSDYVAARWQDGQMEDLDQLASNPDLLIDTAHAINNSGQISVSAINADIRLRGALLTPVAQPCAADLTGDGLLNFFDVSAFLSAFNANEPIADFTGDGLFNFFDVSAFLSAFNAGCP